MVSVNVTPSRTHPGMVFYCRAYLGVLWAVMMAGSCLCASLRAAPAASGGVSPEIAKILKALEKNRTAVREFSGSFVYEMRWDHPGPARREVIVSHGKKNIIEVGSPDRSVQVVKLQWATDGQRVRWTQIGTDPNGTVLQPHIDFAWNGKTGTVLMPDSRMANLYSDRNLLDEEYTARDPRGFSDSSRDLLAELREDGSTFTLREDRVGPTPVVVLVQHTASDRRREFWLDPAENYVPLRIVTFRPGQESAWSETTVHRHVRFKGSDWFVSKSTTVWPEHPEGKLTVHFEAKEVHCGPVPDETFEIAIPDNTLVHEVASDITFVKGGAVPRPHIVDAILDRHVREDLLHLPGEATSMPTGAAAAEGRGDARPVAPGTRKGKPPLIKTDPPLWLIWVALAATVLVVGGGWYLAARRKARQKSSAAETVQ